MKLTELVRQYQNMEQELNQLESMIQKYFEFSPKDLELIINKLLERLKYKERFSCFAIPWSNTKYNDTLVCTLSTHQSYNAEYHLFSYGMPSEFEGESKSNLHEKLKITFDFLRKDTGFWFCDIPVAFQNFEDRPYIKEFIEYFVYYRAEHQLSEFTEEQMDEALDLYIAKRTEQQLDAGKQKVLQPTTND